jgi:hypothetical protein
VEFNDLSAIAKTKSIKIGFMTKGLYRLISPNIPDSESIQDMGEGFDKKSGNKSPIIITDKNVYFFSFTNAIGGLDQRVIPLERITSVSVEGGVLLPSLVISEGTTEYAVEKVGPKAKELMKCINNLKSNNSTIVLKEEKLSVSDEIRELKKLLDDEIITEDEFDKKKKQLLGI